MSDGWSCFWDDTGRYQVSDMILYAGDYCGVPVSYHSTDLGTWTTPRPVEWMCNYCGSPQPKARTHCRQCGAPRGFAYNN